MHPTTLHRIVKTIAAALAAFVFAVTAAHAPAAAAERLLHSYRSLALSPDGSRVVAIESTEAAVDGDRAPSSLVIRKLDGSAPVTIALPCAPDPECDPSSPAWSPDGSTLAFIVHPPKATHRFIYETNADGGALRKILDFDGTLVDLRFSHDGKLAVLATAGAHKEIGATQAGAPIVGVIGEAPDEQRIAIVDAKSGGTAASVTFASPPNLFVYEYAWRPDGGFVGTAATGNGDDNWWIARLYTFDASTATAHEIYKPADPQQQLADPLVSPDGRSVVFIGGLMSDFGSTGGDVFSVPIGGGAATDLTPGMAASVQSLRWGCASATRPPSLLGVVLRGSDMEFDAIPTASSGPTRPILALSTFEEATASGFSVACDGPNVAQAFVMQSFTKPPEIYAARANLADPVLALRNGGGRTIALTHENDGIAAATTAKSLAWTSDGVTVHGWLLAPPHVEPGTKHPLILTVHGGPAAAVTPSFVGRGTTRDLLRAGYYLFYPNPRGSFGAGEAFVRGNVKDFGYGDLRDDLAGIDAAEKIAPIDDARLGIQGGSYGGFMSMWAVTQTHRFKASVASAGVANWISYYGENGIDQWMIPYFGGSAYDDPAVYRKSSPIEFIKNVTTPSLILVGERDVECPAPQSQEYWHALDTLGVPTQLVIYAGEGHGLRQPKDRADATRRTLQWFEKYLAPNAS